MRPLNLAHLATASRWTCVLCVVALLAPTQVALCGAEETGVPDSDVFNESGENPASARKKPHAEEADEEDGRPAVTDDDRGDEPPADPVPAEAEVAPKRLPVTAVPKCGPTATLVREDGASG